MHDATTSDGIEYVGSATHPNAVWRRLPDTTHVGPKGQVLKHEYTLDVDLGQLARGEPTPIISNLVYADAFKDPEREWPETHLEHPTGRLTMIILAPDDTRVTEASGSRSVGRGAAEPTPTQPTVVHEGSVIYWSIDDPLLGARSSVSWHWRVRA